MWFKDYIHALLVRCPESLVVTFSFIYCIDRQMRWGRLPNESLILTTLPQKSITVLKFAYLLRRASLLASTMTLPYWTSGGVSLPSSAHFFFLDGSSACCFPSSWWGASRDLTSDGGRVSCERSWRYYRSSWLRGSMRPRSPRWPNSVLHWVQSLGKATHVCWNKKNMMSTWNRRNL